MTDRDPVEDEPVTVGDIEKALRSMIEIDNIARQQFFEAGVMPPPVDYDYIVNVSLNRLLSSLRDIIRRRIEA